MLAVQLTELLDADRERVDDALALVSDIDAALVSGFGRPDAARDAALAALASAVAATPLAESVAAAVEAVAAGTVDDEALSAVAAARAAILGAVHDRLQSDLDEAIGRDRVAFDAEPADAPAETAALRGAARAWLTELAIAGFSGVTAEFVSGSTTLVEGLHRHPSGRRLAVLIDGLAAELAASDPVGALPVIPARRWADMWTRAETLSRERHPATVPVERLTGRFLPIGAEAFEHPAVFGLIVHGLFENDDDRRLMRATITIPKVDAVSGPSMWSLLADQGVLRTALAEDLALDVTDMPAVGADLLWDDAAATAGEHVDPLATARLLLEEATAVAASPLDRHPVALAEPVIVDCYKVVKGDVPRFDLGGAILDVDVDRLSPVGPITVKHIAASTTCVGVLRWDGGRWSLSPMLVETPVKRRPTVVHTGQWANGPTDPKVEKAVDRVDVVGTLRERAGRLLRR